MALQRTIHTPAAPGPIPPESTIGFGGHEQEDNVGLINMGGRIYDPRTARFLTADPELTWPMHSQGYNPYSYALNSPPRFVDPTGFDSEPVEITGGLGGSGVGGGSGPGPGGDSWGPTFGGQGLGSGPGGGSGGPPSNTSIPSGSAGTSVPGGSLDSSIGSGSTVVTGSVFGDQHGDGGGFEITVSGTPVGARGGVHVLGGKLLGWDLPGAFKNLSARMPTGKIPTIRSVVRELQKSRIPTVVFWGNTKNPVPISTTAPMVDSKGALKYIRVDISITELTLGGGQYSDKSQIRPETLLSHELTHAFDLIDKELGGALTESLGQKIQSTTKEARAFEVENNFRDAARLKRSSMEARGYNEDD